MLTHPQFAIEPIPDPRNGRTFGPCPKCLSMDTHVSYHRAKVHTDWNWQIHGGVDCKYDPICDEEVRNDEHLVVYCRRCRYTWHEDIS